MVTSTLCAAIQGVEVCTVNIEVNVVPQREETLENPVSLIGLPDAAIRESRGRIWSALQISRFRVPNGRTTINLAPADLRKSGAAYDLPIALCLLAATGMLEGSALTECMVIGELALNGEIRPVCGALPIAMHARQTGIRRMLVPLDNAAEAAAVSGIDIFGLRSLPEAVEFLNRQTELAPVQINLDSLFQTPPAATLDFADVKGQETAKRALLIAATGNHNVLMIGQPGVGKSLIANRIPGILPQLTLEEALEVTKVHSIAGLLPAGVSLLTSRPFRAPHHTVSDAGLLGGGKNIPRPGEISLAHHGVLFLDELPEYRRNVLEVLRQPLESGNVSLARAAGNFVFPARVMLVAAMNPCPCGYAGSATRRCSCPPFAIQNYRARISGPLLDRIDLHIEVPPISPEQLAGRHAGETSASLRQKVQHARQRQLQRFGHTGIRDNASICGKFLDEFCPLESGGQRFLSQAVERLGLSARSYDRILRVARTIADLADADTIHIEHLAEAFNYRVLDRDRH